MSTIKDVAKLAGVSVATVSRALNDGYVHKATKEKILKAIERLNYRPNHLGRNLRLQKTSMIIVILDSLANDFYAKVIRGIEERASEQGYKLMICPVHNDPLLEEAYISLLKNKVVDGAIFMNTSLDFESFFNLSQGYSLVQCSEHFMSRDISWVSIDNRQAAYDAVDYLIQQGRENIAFITVDNSNITTTHRRLGYEDALRAHGMKILPHLTGVGAYGYRSAYAALSGILDKGVTPGGVFAISDRMAAGAIKCAIDRGFKVPGDIGIVGFDNTDFSGIYIPSITTVSQSQFQMGKAAFDLLYERISNGSVRQEVLGYELLIRQSTG